jgi:hypothetical protein
MQKEDEAGRGDLILHELPPASAGGFDLRGRLKPNSEKEFSSLQL